eukprot:SAG11_NODE_1765_length_4285_cov_3.009795_3_plen_241_part_00
MDVDGSGRLSYREFLLELEQTALVGGGPDPASGGCSSTVLKILGSHTPTHVDSMAAAAAPAVPSSAELERKSEEARRQSASRWSGRVDPYALDDDDSGEEELAPASAPPTASPPTASPPTPTAAPSEEELAPASAPPTASPPTASPPTPTAAPSAWGVGRALPTTVQVAHESSSAVVAALQQKLAVAEGQWGTLEGRLLELAQQQCSFQKEVVSMQVSLDVHLGYIFFFVAPSFLTPLPW